ncbi:MAG: alpha/beta hydrolase [Kofleriaceae bacterium]|nr:alpha/beta hydrolase [Kofleriaceae bacterium]
MSNLLDHPAISERYFFPRATRPPLPWVVEAENIELACWRSDRGRPASVLHFHGNGEVVDDWGDFARALDASGVDVVLAEYRGYGGSSGRPSLTKLLDDALVVFDAVTALGRKAETIVVYGRSIGSLAAAHVAAHRPVRGLVLESGINDLYERLALRVEPAEIGATDEQLRSAVTRLFDQTAKIARSTCPVLVLHCEHDDMVRKHHAERNAAAAGGRAQLVIYPRGDHNTIHAFNGDAIVEAVTMMARGSGD